MPSMDAVPDPLCYVNGSFLPLSEVVISPRDLGFLRGYAVFDVMLAENGAPFLWDRHYDRLMRSALELGLHVPVDKAAYKQILDTLIGRNPGLDKILLRTVLSGGPSANGFVPHPSSETFVILVEETHVVPETFYTDGVKLITLAYERPIPQVKLANHVMAIRDLPRRVAAKAYEVLYVNDGQVSEASQSNLFLVQGGRLITTWDNVLWGITQGLVLELATQIGIPTEKRNISVTELLSAEEVFVTGSSKYIVPVVRIDETVISTGVPGAVTKRLQSALINFVKNY